MQRVRPTAPSCHHNNVVTPRTCTQSDSLLQKRDRVDDNDFIKTEFQNQKINVAEPRVGAGKIFETEYLLSSCALWPLRTNYRYGSSGSTFLTVSQILFAPSPPPSIADGEHCRRVFTRGAAAARPRATATLLPNFQPEPCTFCGNNNIT